MTPLGGLSIPTPWDVVEGITDGLDFASDPLGWAVEQMQGALAWITTSLLPSLMHALEPDLSADWFLRSYAMSFGIAMLVWVVILIFQAVRTAQGAASGGDLVDALTRRSGLFIVGATFGPAVGSTIVELFGALSDSILESVNTSSTETMDQWRQMIVEGQWKGMGGAVVGVCVLLALLIASFLVVIMLLCAYVALYLSGAIFPLAWVWIVDGARAQIGWRLVWVWVCLCAAHPLLFLMLGVAFSFVLSGPLVLDDPSLATFMNALAAIVVLVFAAGSPILLFKFAPVLPSGAGQAMPSVSAGGRGGPSGPSSPSDAAQQQASDGEASAAPGTASAPTGGTGNGNGGAGPLESAALDAGRGPSADAGAPGAAKNSSPGGGGSAPQGVDVPTQPTPVGGGLASAGESSGTGALGARAGASAAGGAAAGGASGAGSAAAASEGLAVVGAGETATGAGAVIGVPTLLLAGAAQVAAKTADLAEQGAQISAGDMNEGGTQ